MGFKAEKRHTSSKWKILYGAGPSLVQLVQEVGGGAKGKHSLSFPFTPSSPQLCALHAKEGPAR